jgi:hypothetical protein
LTSAPKPPAIRKIINQTCLFMPDQRDQKKADWCSFCHEDQALATRPEG